MKKKLKFDNKLLIVIFINLFIFAIDNVIFSIKYEQVDDFIIYNLYSGLDGTYNLHGVYIHSIICMVIGVLYRIIPIINWHTIFLISMQLLCFTIIGYKIIKKHNNQLSIVLYTIFAGVMFTALLMLIQYTSVAALLIFTSLFLFIDNIENNKKNTCLSFILYTIGIMLREQSVLIIAPFFLIIFIIKIIKKDQIASTIKYFLIYAIITIVIFLSNAIIYNFDSVYKEYTEYNKLRTLLHDRMNLDYEQDKEIFDEIGWSKNDFFMFATFGFGDENIYSKEKLQKIVDYKIEKDGIQNVNKDIKQVSEKFITATFNANIIIVITFAGIFIIGLFGNPKKNILIFLTTVLINLVFIIMGRDMLRVVIPEYIAGTALMLYNMKLKPGIINESTKNCIVICCIIIVACFKSGKIYEFNYKLSDYKNLQTVINYTNSNKNNVYLYTVPALQYRYLAYPVYLMPPKASFSNLRVIGGWDMFTQNYYDFKQRYALDGNLLDLLKENVYLIDGDVVWSGTRYDNYKANIILSIKENYNINVKCEEIKAFENIKIYKLREE